MSALGLIAGGESELGREGSMSSRSRLVQPPALSNRTDFADERHIKTKLSHPECELVTQRVGRRLVGIRCRVLRRTTLRRHSPLHRCSTHPVAFDPLPGVRSFHQCSINQLGFDPFRSTHWCSIFRLVFWCSIHSLASSRSVFSCPLDQKHKATSRRTLFDRTQQTPVILSPCPGSGRKEKHLPPVREQTSFLTRRYNVASAVKADSEQSYSTSTQIHCNLLLIYDPKEPCLQLFKSFRS